MLQEVNKCGYISKEYFRLEEKAILWELKDFVLNTN